MENYEKKYKDALERAKKIVNDQNASSVWKGWLCNCFPELKESEDERIRNEIILYIGARDDISLDIHNKWLSWLEKQVTPQVRTGIEWVNTIDDVCDKRYSEEYAHGEYCHEQSFKWGFQEGVDWLEKQDEQKPVIEMKSAEESLGIDSDTYNEIVDECIYGEQKPTDKVEPKFHEGEWIEDEIEIPFGAKDSELQEASYHIPKDFHAEIDGNKVVIKKGDQKPAWSDEDEVMLVSIISDFAAAHKSSIGQDKWLKSLKERMKGE